MVGYAAQKPTLKAHAGQHSVHAHGSMLKKIKHITNHNYPQKPCKWKNEIS